MPQKKLTREEIDRSIGEKQDFLVTEMAKVGESVAPIQEELTAKIHIVSGEILELFKQKKQIETDQKVQEENKDFSKIEEEVLEYLPENERTRITIMRKVLRDNDGDYFETSYKQVIMKIYLGEVTIENDSVVFHYVGKQLDRQELQLPTTDDGDISDYTYEDFIGKIIQRRCVREKVLDENDRNYHYIQEAQEKLKQEGKYIATEENTFSHILNGFEGTEKQKIKALQYFTNFIGRGIISLEKNKNNCLRLLKSGFYKKDTGIYNDTILHNSGSLFVARDI